MLHNIIRIMSWTLAVAVLAAVALFGATGVRADGDTAIYLPMVVTGNQSAPNQPAPPQPTPNQPTPTLPRGSVPAKLVGTWFSGQLLNLTYYNRDTGVWGNAGGLGHMIVIAADGSYTRVSHLEIGGGSTCVSSVDVYSAGVARAEGNQLLLTPSYARTRTVTCGTTVSDTEGPYDTAAIPWRVGEDEQRHTRLWLSEAQGETAYYRDGVGPQVIGGWATGDGGAVELYDPATGAWADPTGASSVWYNFGADGSYRHGRVEAGYGGDPCRPIAMTYEAGTLEGSGSELRLQPTAVLRHTVSLCDPTDFYDEALAPGAQERWTWLFAADGETLSIIRVSSGFQQHMLSRVP